MSGLRVQIWKRWIESTFGEAGCVLYHCPNTFFEYDTVIPLNQETDMHPFWPNKVLIVCLCWLGALSAEELQYNWERKTHVWWNPGRIGTWNTIGKIYDCFQFFTFLHREHERDYASTRGNMDHLLTRFVGSQSCTIVSHVWVDCLAVWTFVCSDHGTWPTNSAQNQTQWWTNTIQVWPLCA